MHEVHFYESRLHEEDDTRLPFLFRSYRNRADAEGTAQELMEEDFVYRAWVESE